MSEAVISDVLSSPPFVSVPGVMNMRTLGGGLAPGRIKQSHIFRSAELSQITDDGKSKLLSLGITTVFDMRSDVEIARNKSATPNIEGISVVRIPVTSDAAWNTENITATLKRYEQNELTTFVEEYASLLLAAGPAFNAIFTHLRDKPLEPCLVHCTSGKDRTGLVAAILLLLLGDIDDNIIKDYALTTDGIAPFAAQLTERYRAVPVLRDNWDGFLKMASSREETMVATLAMIRERFGGADKYLKTHAGLVDDDLAVIRKNLLAT